MADHQVKLFQHLAAVNQATTTIYPYSVYARINYKHLKSLFERERLTDDLENRFAEEIADKHDL
jgi:hypothetical protein